MNKKYMLYAISLAKGAAKNGEIPVAAVIVKDGKIIGEGVNAVEKDGSVTAHAEMIAIKNAEHKYGRNALADSEIYVTLEPCPMCAGAIINARIKTVIFGAYEKNSGSFDSVVNLASLKYPNTPEVYGGIEEDACKELLTGFFENLRKEKEGKNKENNEE